jgi:hypothetical protein
LTEFVIPASVETPGEACLCHCKSHFSVRFESMSKLKRIETNVFNGSGLTCIVIPSSVEIIEDECFCYCEQLQSVTYEGGSRLRKVGRNVFYGSAIRQVVRLGGF